MMYWKPKREAYDFETGYPDNYIRLIEKGLLFLHIVPKHENPDALKKSHIVL